MAIRAVVFDIGGVLEITPQTGWIGKWETRLHLNMAEVMTQMDRTGRNGSLGTCTEAEWVAGLREITGMGEAQTEAMMQDIWHEYLGTLNVELADYFASLRPRYRTAMLSNSFLGARRKEQERYHFDKLTDLIIYSHEEGIAKPDPRIYELTCQRLGLQPNEIIFLDDAAPNIVAAREFGIHAILFKDNTQAIADIEACLQAYTTAP